MQSQKTVSAEFSSEQLLLAFIERIKLQTSFGSMNSYHSILIIVVFKCYFSSNENYSGERAQNIYCQNLYQVCIQTTCFLLGLLVTASSLTCHLAHATGTYREV